MDYIAFEYVVMLKNTKNNNLKAVSARRMKVDVRKESGVDSSTLVYMLKK